MKKQKKYEKYEVLRVVDIKILLNVSYTQANKYYNEMKSEYKCPDVLFCHFEKYFNT